MPLRPYRRYVLEGIHITYLYALPFPLLLPLLFFLSLFFFTPDFIFACSALFAEPV
jgi:hypothetical protein